jgi:hypothetical protein
VTPQEQKLFARLHRRAASVSPELAAAILLAWARLRESMPEAALARAIALGAERVFELVLTQAVLDVALAPIRQRLRESIVKAVPYYASTLPPKVVGEVTLGFDILSPHVVDAIRGLETRVMTQFATDLRETVREAVTRGLTDGLSHRTVAKGLRQAIGLAPSQARDVEAYRVKLENAHKRSDAFDNKLRDRRFDAALKKARATGEPLPKERIEKMVDAYRRRRINQNAAINARQAAVDAQKLANRLAWDDAIAQGAVDAGSLQKTWRGVMDDRERESHRAHEGETVPFDQPYSGGYMVAGSPDWGCRCVDVYSVRAA